jgi:hypothetical protein
MQNLEKKVELRQSQKETIEFGIQRKGRLFIANDKVGIRVIFREWERHWRHL